LKWYIVQQRLHLCAYAWFPPFRCRSAVAVSALALRKFCKNYVAYVKKNPLRRCRFHLTLRRNRRFVAIESNPIFAVLPLVDNQSAFWSLHPYVYGKTFPAFLFSPQRQR